MTTGCRENKFILKGSPMLNLPVTCLKVAIASAACLMALASCTNPAVVVVNSNGVVAGGSNAGAQQQAVSKPVIRGAISGQRQDLGYSLLVLPDCTSGGLEDVRVVKAPEHGKVSIEQEDRIAEFNKDNVRSACNNQKFPGRVVYYTSDAGFTGTDTFAIERIAPGGWFNHHDFVVNVR
jgi:hypothetical protein